MDLKCAHEALGRKAFENRVLPEKFAKQYEEIGTLTKKIAVEREGMKSAESATAMERLKPAAMSGEMSAAAKVHDFKLKQLYTNLAGDLAANELPELCRTEGDAVRGVEVQIQRWKKEVLASLADKSSRDEMIAAWQGLIHGKNRRYSVAALFGVVLLVGIAYASIHGGGSTTKTTQTTSRGPRTHLASEEETKQRGGMENADRKEGVQHDRSVGFEFLDLGLKHAKGEGVRKDDAKAVEYYQKAAEQGKLLLKR